MRSSHAAFYCSVFHTTHKPFYRICPTKDFKLVAATAIVFENLLLQKPTELCESWLLMLIF